PGARRLRRPRPQHRRPALDRDARGPGVRFERRAARLGRGLRRRRRPEEVRRGFRGGLDQGHGTGPVRPARL
ncbi:hypothetical protein LTR94_028576, partial [Friedmanniomyces endolithicus]